MKIGQLISFVYLTMCFSFAGVAVYDYTGSHVLGLGLYLSAFFVFTNYYVLKGDE